MAFKARTKCITFPTFTLAKSRQKYTLVYPTEKKYKNI